MKRCCLNNRRSCFKIEHKVYNNIIVVFFMAKPGPKPKRVVDPTWTPELAYVCGLMASDGCLYNDGRHLNLTSKDIQLLETFKKCLGLKNKIGWKPGGYNGTGSTQVQWGDVTLYKWFISIGITPRKTHTIGRIKVPDKFFFDCVRGEFDGDGSSHAYWDTRWHSSVSLYISFCCASKKHLEWLNEKVTQLINVTGLIRKYSSVYYLEFSKTKARQVFEAMYHEKSVPHLVRKKRKLDRQWKALELSRQGKQPANFHRGGSVIAIT